LKPDKPSTQWTRISGRLLIIILAVATVAGVALTVASFYLNSAPTGTTSMTGTLYVNSAGQLHASANYTATYNVTLSSKNGVGTMNLTLINGTTDALTVHDFTVANLVANPYNLTMSVNGKAVALPWLSNSTVWKQNNESYIASWGPEAPANQQVGSIAPQDFPGLQPGYYLVLILTVPSQPSNNIPFMIETSGGPQVKIAVTSPHEPEA
jgi:hypothetical protein